MNQTKTIIVTTIIVLILVGAGFGVFKFMNGQIEKAKQEGALEFATLMYTNLAFPTFSEGGNITLMKLENICTQLNNQEEVS